MMKLLSTSLAACAVGIMGFSIAGNAAEPSTAGNAIPAFGSSPLAQERDAGQAFDRLKRRLDKNLDGKISKAEFNRNARSFDRMDSDGDGVLTKAEFVAARGKAGAGRGKPAPAQGESPKKPEATSPATTGEPTAEQLEFFEKSVRPVLANNCYRCHSDGAQRLKAGLKLDSREGFLRGSEYGPVMVPGDLEASSFIEAIRYGDPDFGMPPKEKLSDQEISDLEKWVAMGAPWAPEVDMGTVEMTPGNFEEGQGTESLNRDVDIEAGRNFWSFKAPVRHEAPIPHQEGWAQGAIDQFLLVAMEAANIAPVKDADDRTWLRRITFDITGLPPTPNATAAFLSDKSEQRDARVVDRLLASEGYAERWGRHWLDVARYAESSGKEQNVLYPHAWRYRDWVLKAFEQDMPYNRFLQLQLAGDLTPVSDSTEMAWNQIATGYLAIGSKGHANRNRVEFQLDMVDEQIDAMSQGMLGLTVSCARCHDHKFDPIPTKDYYALAGIFYSTETHFGTLRSPGNNQSSDLIPLPEGVAMPNGPTMDADLQRLVKRGPRRGGNTPPQGQGTESMEGSKMDEASSDEPSMSDDDKREAARRTAQLTRRRTQQQGVLDDLRSRFDESGRALPTNLLAMGVSEGEPRDIAVLERGELDRPGEVVHRNMPQVLRAVDMPAVTQGSGRLELAQWVASSDNPLTARVWANRVWLHLFGTGLVSTPDNFGAAGQIPTHPELLDWLATELVAKGWSTKALIREITLSRAYRLSSRSAQAAEAIDPDVRLLWRMPKRRLESEALRDAMLTVSGSLSTAKPVGSPTGTFEGLLRNEQIAKLLLREQNVRSVYLPNPRGFTMETLAAFDAPDSDFVTGDRDETTVATQALFLMNDTEVLRLSDAFAQRLLGIEGNEKDQIRAGFELAYGRPPTSIESKAVRSFLRDYAREAETTIDKESAQDSGRGNARQSARRRARERARDASNGVLAPIQDPKLAAWSAFAQSLFQSAEFRILD
jgi:cytochrome c553